MSFADYVIIAVRYNSSCSHLDKLKVRPLTTDNKMGDPKEWTRKEVVEAIAKGKTFYTIYNKSGEWQKGQKVEVIEVATKFLKTKADRTDADNLENLPLF